MNADPAPEWLPTLLTVLQARLDELAEPSEEQLARVDAVWLAHALARRLDLPADREPGPQIVVCGPTQAGKSTLVNRLLDAPVAGVSALAGHTVHAQAFVPHERLDEVRAALSPLMAPLNLREREQLTLDRLGDWSLQAVTPGPQALAPPTATLWDTPDFDSIESHRYRRAVTLSAGLADVLVLVLSKDKYGDERVWRHLTRLRQLGTPLVLAINKVDAASRATIEAALQARLAEQVGGAPHAVVLLPWQDPDAAPAGDSLAVQRALLDAVVSALQASTDRARRRNALRAFIDAHRDDWLSPLRDEHAVRQQWEQAVAEASTRIRDGYRRDWLESAAGLDAFDRTLLELLTLLEVPGLARVLSRTRQAVTWPARRLLGAAGRAVRQRTGDPRPVRVRERELLETLFDAALTDLRERVLDAREAGISTAAWRRIDARLGELRGPLRTRWSDAAAALHDRFQPRIEAAAQQLYERLQEQPALLNTLRATRLGTDAAGVALAVKSGGMAPADLVLAPAMLSVTSLLTESALGRYLDGIKRQLRREQLALLDEHLLLALFEPALCALSSDGDATDPSGPAHAALLAEVEASVSRVGPSPTPPH